MKVLEPQYNIPSHFGTTVIPKLYDETQGKTVKELFTSVKEVMFCPAFVCLSVCLFVYKITWQCGYWDKKRMIKFW